MFPLSCLRSLLTMLMVVPVWGLPEAPGTQVGRRRDGSPILAADLRQGAPWDLAGAVFDLGADLDGVDFAGTDLSGACLRQVSLRGANLKGANLKGADLPVPAPTTEGQPAEVPPPVPAASAGEGAAPTPLNADLSHFFAQGLPLGTIRELTLEGLRQGHVKHLFPLGGGIAWTCTQYPIFFAAFPSGLSVLGGCLAPTSLGWIPEKRTVWMAANQGQDLFMLPAKVFEGRASLIQARPFGPLLLPPSEAASRPGGMVRSPDGLFYRITDDGALCCFPGKWVYRIGALCGSQLSHPVDSLRCPDLAFESLVACEDGKVLCLCQDHLACIAPGQVLDKGLIHVFRAKGIRRATASPTGVWFTVPAQNAIKYVPFEGWFSGKEAELQPYSLGSSNGQVFDLALGQDGMVWFTELRNSSIGRLDPQTGAILRFPLPIPGSKPAYLVNGGDGKLYFTQLGSQRLGSIAALEPTPQPPSPEPRTEPAPAPMTEPAPAPMTEPAPAPMTEPAPAPMTEPAPELRTGRPPTPKVEAPALAARPLQPLPLDPPPVPRLQRRPSGALQALASLCPEGVNWAHIQAEHGYGAPSAKGQFLRSLEAREALAGVIAQCLVAPLCPLFLTCEGKWMAFRSFPEPVGYHLQGQTWIATTRMVVVLSPDRSYVVTAYPVGPNF